MDCDRGDGCFRIATQGYQVIYDKRMIVYWCVVNGRAGINWTTITV